MPRRNRARRDDPEPLRPIGAVTPSGMAIDGWTVRASAKGGSPCPYCNRPIPPGTSHIVAWPDDEPDLRKHWHTGCFERERRRGGPAL